MSDSFEIKKLLEKTMVESVKGRTQTRAEMVKLGALLHIVQRLDGIESHLDRMDSALAALQNEVSGLQRQR